MPGLKAVIFDMDGVIIDSEPIHQMVNKSIFSTLGINISAEEYNSFIGLSNTEMWTYLKEKYDFKEDVKELKARQLKGNLQYLNNNSEKMVHGIKKLLDLFSKHNLNLAVASSSPLEYINNVLINLDINDYFEIRVSGEAFEKGKPFPDIFIYTAKLLKVMPEECVIIEDSENGVLAAKEAGIRVVGYKNKNSGKQDLSAADLIVNSLKGLEIKDFERLLLK
ncbi:MAG TPA: HAD family phosphatase [Halanaerobiales bacterium]|nr:HAD family phosphatase [Halanaerobiales bacterium]